MKLTKTSFNHLCAKMTLLNLIIQWKIAPNTEELLHTRIWWPLKVIIMMYHQETVLYLHAITFNPLIGPSNSSPTTLKNLLKIWWWIFRNPQLREKNPSSLFLHLRLLELRLISRRESARKKSANYSKLDAIVENQNALKCIASAFIYKFSAMKTAIV